jgi:alkylhydroperoxidase family enzyme
MRSQVVRVALPPQPDVFFPNLAEVYSPEIIAASNAFSYTTYLHSKLSLRMFEAARIATAVINGCIVCKNWRAQRDVARLGIEQGIRVRGPVPDEAFYEAVLANDLSLLDDKERLCVLYVQRIGQDPQGLAADEEFWSELKAGLSDAEIVDLTYCAACWIGLGRAAHVLGLDIGCGIPAHSVAEAA